MQRYEDPVHTVLITGIGGGGVGEQILKALLLAEKKFRLIGTDITKYSANFNLVNKFYIVPSADDPAYLDSILEICKNENVKTIFYGSEPELKILSIYRHLFSESNIYLPLNPKSVIELCMDKNALGKWLSKNNFCSLKSVQINEVEDADQIDFFPCVLKPAVGSSGSAHVYICQSKNEVVQIASILLSLGIKLVAQKYAGNLESEYTVGILHDENGNFINSIAVRRFISTSLGSRLRIRNSDLTNGHGEYLGISSGISQGEIGKFPQITNVCENIAEKLGCTASLNFQCRLEGDKVYIFEINPRFSGTTSLRALVGFNEPEILIDIHHFAEQIKPGFQYGNGVILRSLNETFIST